MKLSDDGKQRGEETAFENGRISDFQGLVTLALFSFALEAHLLTYLLTCASVKAS